MPRDNDIAIAVVSTAIIIGGLTYYFTKPPEPSKPSITPPILDKFDEVNRKPTVTEIKNPDYTPIEAVNKVLDLEKNTTHLVKKMLDADYVDNLAPVNDRQPDKVTNPTPSQFPDFNYDRLGRPYTPSMFSKKFGETRFFEDGDRR